MPGRVNSRLGELVARREAHSFLQSRGLAWLMQRQYCIGTDYILRALNMKSKDPVNLLLGQCAGKVLGEQELVNRCDEWIQRLMVQKGVSDATSLLRSCGSRRTDDVLAVIAESAAIVSSNPSTHEREETLIVRERSTRAQEQAMVDEAVSRVVQQGDRLVEVLEPQDSTYGRGLYACSRIKKGSLILRDKAIMAQRMNGTSCAHCLSPLEKKGGTLGVSCEHCEETYCSAACKTAAFTQYHQCVCSHVNPTYSDWVNQMRQVVEQGCGEMGVDARAALACLAVGKALSMCTVAQKHPLEMSGFGHLRGFTQFESRTGLSNVGAMAVTLSSALHQPNLHVEEILSLFAIIQTNEFLVPNGILLFPVLSLMNHSCTPNCVAVGPSDNQQQLVAVSDIRPGEQLMINYNPQLTGSMSFEERRALFSQRNFECFCSRCILRK